MLEIHQIPALRDNYIYLIRDQATEVSAAIDPSEASPVLTFLKKNGWQLDYVLNTHHHWDHTGGNIELKEKTGCRVVGFRGDQHRIPGIDETVDESKKFSLGRSIARVIEIPGHTLGQIAFWFEEDEALFCGDTLFSIGCGRLFEGTAEQMYRSLNKLKQLPPSTKIYCGHEYTEKNILFALSLSPQDPELLSYQKEVQSLLTQKKSSIPSRMKIELELNPFLKARSAAELKDIREKKDQF